MKVSDQSRLERVLVAVLTLATAPVAQNSLLVSDRNGDRVLRYDATSGALLATFTASGLDNPVGLTFGPDGNLYVASALNDAIQRYDGASGAFLGTFATVDDARQLNFGPDGNLYVASAPAQAILRFDGASGAPLGLFASGGGLNGPTSFTFGPDGDLYVGSVLNDRIKRYDGVSGAFLGNFVSTNLDGPHDLSFGPDGNLYVTNAFLTRIQRFDGVSGAFLGTFVNDARLSAALGLSWDEHGDLLVVNQGRDEILRYDGRSGAFLGALVAPGSGISSPLFACFAPAPSFDVRAPTPGTSGVTNTWRIAGATPGARLRFGLGRDLRLRRIPGCASLTTLALPVSLADVTLVADESGCAAFARAVPLAAIGRTFLARAAEPRLCRMTGFLFTTF